MIAEISQCFGGGGSGRHILLSAGRFFSELWFLPFSSFYCQEKLYYIHYEYDFFLKLVYHLDELRRFNYVQCPGVFLKSGKSLSPPADHTEKSSYFPEKLRFSLLCFYSRLPWKNIKTPRCHCKNLLALR